MSADSERLSPPNDPAAFESMCLDLWREIWGDRGAQKNGRSGQAQAGVDVFGKADGGWVGVQCKQKDGLLRSRLSVGELEVEVETARTFEPPLHRFIVATSGARDGKVQKRARELSEPGFEVQVWSWAEIWHELYLRRELFARIFPVYWPLQAGMRARRVSPTRLPRVTGELFGRERELAALDAAWADPQTRVVSLVAWGGVGKTSLVAKWVAGLAARDHDGADYFDWSFYSQGTREQGGASADLFIDAALRFFGDEAMADSPRSPWDKGARLAQLVAERRTLLVLDGLEPLQHPPGPLAGELQDPAMATLLKGLAARNPGLCVVTTRERVADLGRFEGTTVQSSKLEHLSVEAGVELLKALGVHGAAAELRQLVEGVKGHALTLNLLGRFLRDAHGGDVRKRDLVRFEEADAEIQGGHAFRVMEAYERWFAGEGEKGERLLAVLRLLGLFDRPASIQCLAALRQPAVITGLTDAIVGLSEVQWNLSISWLAECGLVIATEGALDSHPLVREHFARQLHEKQPAAWRAAHGRLFDYLKNTTENQPETLAGLQPLYQAVAHGCLAGRHEEARADVFRERIQRSRERFSTFKLGATGADLAAVAYFFEALWNHPSPMLEEPHQAWFLHEAAFRLRALGRLTEAVEPLELSLEINERKGEWGNAAVVRSTLSELKLVLGDVVGSVFEGARSVVLADLGGDDFDRMDHRTVLADALYQQGRVDQALTSFQEAETMQAVRQPARPQLYSVRGFRFCTLLLGVAEHAASRGQDYHIGSREACCMVELRAMQSLGWNTLSGRLLDFALDHLIIGCAQLYRALLEGTTLENPMAELEEAVDGLRRAGQAQYVPLGLLTRAWLRHAMGDADGARADLDEAQEIAERGPMPLHLADVNLYRARLFHDRTALAEARRLVDTHGYGRRLEELADLEAEADTW